MAIGSTALVNLVIFLIIGAVIGLALTAMRAAGSCVLARRHTAISPPLGITGEFIGFNISVILGLLPSPLVHFVLAALGL